MKPNNENFVNDATYHALIAMLWSTTYDHDGMDTPLEESYGDDDVEDETSAAIRNAVSLIIHDYEYDVPAIIARHSITAEQFGHDVWLTSQGHGAGFWDRGYGDDGDVLTELAQSCEIAYCDPYITDDNMVAID